MCMASATSVKINVSSRLGNHNGFQKIEKVLLAKHDLLCQQRVV